MAKLNLMRKLWASRAICFQFLLHPTSPFPPSESNNANLPRIISKWALKFKRFLLPKRRRDGTQRVGFLVLRQGDVISHAHLRLCLFILLWCGWYKILKALRIESESFFEPKCTPEHTWRDIRKDMNKENYIIQSFPLKKIRPHTVIGECDSSNLDAANCDKSNASPEIRKTQGVVLPVSYNVRGRKLIKHC